MQIFCALSSRLVTLAARHDPKLAAEEPSTTLRGDGSDLSGSPATSQPTPTPPHPPTPPQKAPSETPAPPPVVLSQDAETRPLMELLRETLEREGKADKLVTSISLEGQYPSWIPAVVPHDVVEYQNPKSNVSLNQGCTYFMQVPGQGKGVAKFESQNGWCNSYAEFLTSEVDAHLPAVAGDVSEPVVPQTSLVWIEHPVAATLKDGQEAEPAPRGLYTFQHFLDDAVEYRFAPTDPSQPLHPGYIRMGYLDALGFNLDRSVANFMKTPDGRPHATDNGLLFNETMRMPEEYADVLKLLDIVPENHWKGFLQDSLAYAEQAKSALTDVVLNDIFDRLKQVPAYRNVPLHKLLEQTKYNRDHIPDLIRSQL